MATPASCCRHGPQQLAGVSGELAAALVALEVDFTVVESYADLQRGVESATRRG